MGAQHPGAQPPDTASLALAFVAGLVTIAIATAIGSRGSAPPPTAPRAQPALIVVPPVAGPPPVVTVDVPPVAVVPAPSVEASPPPRHAVAPPVIPVARTRPSGGEVRPARGAHPIAPPRGATPIELE